MLVLPWQQLHRRPLGSPPTPLQSTIDNPRSGEHNVTLDQEEWKLLQPVEALIKDPAVADAQ